MSTATCLIVHTSITSKQCYVSFYTDFAGEREDFHTEGRMPAFTGWKKIYIGDAALIGSLSQLFPNGIEYCIPITGVADMKFADGSRIRGNMMINQIVQVVKSLREITNTDKSLIIKCKNTRKSSLVYDKQYPIVEFFEDMVVIEDANGEEKSYKLNRFELE